VRGYRHDLLHFLKHQEDEDNFTLEDFTADALTSYFSSLSVSPTTLARRQSALSSFCNWLRDNSYRTINPLDKIQRVKLPERLPQAKKKSELAKLFAVMKQRNDEYSRRDYALFLLLYQSGLRVSEALSLRISDVNFHNQTIRIFGKGQIESIIPFSTQTKNALRAYLRTRRDKTDKSYLFLSYRKGKLGYRQVNTLLKEYAKQAGIEDITPHSLRHSFCMHLLASGRNLREIQQLARHKSIQSTVRYLSLSSSQTIKAYRKSEETLEI
jgi:site-specific recombinase XerD